LWSLCPVLLRAEFQRPNFGREPGKAAFFRAAAAPSSLAWGLAWNLHFVPSPDRAIGSIRGREALAPSDNDAKAMKMITAIIRPWKLDDLQMAVARLGVQGITVTEVTGYGRQRGHTEHFRGAEYSIEFVPKLRVEIVLDEASAEAVIEAISNVCRTGKTGDGKIFLAPVGEAVRIRTRESGAAAA
jgi:nitrogen regulatory protein PII